MSFGGDAAPILDAAVDRLTQENVVVIAAAGNAGTDACAFSPARSRSAVTVGASTTDDAVASFSNVGACVSLFAPGTTVAGASFASDTGTRTLSGTSMAAPFAAGAAALVLEGLPSLTPAQVKSTLLCGATVGGVRGVPLDTPSLLLFTNPDGWDTQVACGISAAASSGPALAAAVCAIIAALACAWVGN